MTVTWEASGFADCAVDYDGVEFATGVSGTANVVVDRSSVLSVLCDGDVARARSESIEVGPSADVYAVAVPNRGHVVASWSTRMLTTCDLNLASGARFGGETQAGLTRALFEANFASDPAVGALEATLDCTGFAAGVLLTTVIPDTNPMRIENVHTNPAAAPADGGPVQICWQSTAFACVEFGNSDEEGNRAEGTACVDVEIESLSVSDFRDRELHCETDATVLEADDVFFTIATGAAANVFATPTSLTGPGPVSLAWSSAEALSCEVRDDAGALVASGLSGATSVTVAEDTLFRVECTDADGPIPAAEVLVPVGAHIAALSARAAPEGDRVLLSWDAPGASRCAVAATNGVGSVTLDNIAPYPARRLGGGRLFSFEPRRVSELPLLLDLLSASAGATSVQLSCTDATGAVVSATVNVPPPSEAVIESLVASPTDLPGGGGVIDVCWTSTGAQSCSLTLMDDSTGVLQQFDGGAAGCADDVTVDGTSHAFLSCFGALGNDDEQLLIAVGPTIRDFTASPRTLDGPGPTVVSWDVAQVAACTLRGDDGSVIAAGAGLGAVAVSLDTATTFSLTCDGGLVSDELTVPVGPSIVELDPFVVDATIVQLHFATFRVDQCSVRGIGTDGTIVDLAVGIFGGCDLLIGTCDVGAFFDFTLHGDLTVTATCSAGAATVTRSVTLAAGDPTPTFSAFSVDPPVLPTGGGSTDLCWQSVNADQCSFDGADVPLSGCVTRSYDTTSLFSLLCANERGPRSIDQQILVGPGVATVGFDRPQVVLADEATATLTWQTNELASCAVVELDGSIVAVPVNGSRAITFTEPGELYVELRCEDVAGASYLGFGGIRVF